MLLALVYVCHTYAFCGQSPYVVTFHADPTELDRFTTLRNVLSTPPLSPAEWPMLEVEGGYSEAGGGEGHP
jgi:hypothetical protein